MSELEQNDDNISDDDDNMIDYIRFPSEYENEVQDSDTLSDSHNHVFNACPTSFTGSLKMACQAAFSPTTIEERRPVLVYIHHNDNLSKEEFFKTIFYSNKIIDYLNINYVVWQYEITFQPQIDMLKNIWKEIFSTPFNDDFLSEQCPLLIGIMPLYEQERDGVKKPEYQFKELVKDNKLIDSEIPLTFENLWNKLNNFREEFDKNQEILLPHYIQETRLCAEVAVNIAEYLSLNDTISTFSINTYLLLNKFQSKFELSNPCDPFLKMILPKIDSKQIISLKFNKHESWSKSEKNFLSNFKQVISLTLHNVLYCSQMNQYEQCFPNLTRIGFYYDNQTDYEILSDVSSQIPSQTRRLEIHHPGILRTYRDIEHLRKRFRITTEVEYFLLNIDYHPSISASNCLQQCELAFPLPLVDFMKQMPNIRYIHIIINNCDIGHFLDDHEWECIVNTYAQLTRIKLQVSKSTCEQKQFLMKKAQEIQAKLRKKRQTIKYRISFL